MSRDPAWAGVPIALTTGSWQRRQFASAIARLPGNARIGSGNLPVVKWYECRKPLVAFVAVLGHQRVGHVAVIAHGDRAMAALDPAVVLLVHDVAVLARLRVVGHVGPAPRIRERVRAEPKRRSEHQHGNRKRRAGAVHSDASWWIGPTSIAAGSDTSRTSGRRRPRSSCRARRRQGSVAPSRQQPRAVGSLWHLP